MFVRAFPVCPEFFTIRGSTVWATGKQNGVLLTTVFWYIKSSKKPDAISHGHILFNLGIVVYNPRRIGCLAKCQARKQHKKSIGSQLHDKCFSSKKKILIYGRGRYIFWELNLNKKPQWLLQLRFFYSDQTMLNQF